MDNRYELSPTSVGLERSFVLFEGCSSAGSAYSGVWVVLDCSVSAGCPDCGAL